MTKRHSATAFVAIKRQGLKSKPAHLEQAEKQLAIYRDIFAEITAKATPISGEDDDIIHYVVPKGCIHRAAGKTGFQMFDGEKYMKNALERIRELEAQLKAASQPQPSVLSEKECGLVNEQRKRCSSDTQGLLAIIERLTTCAVPDGRAS